MSKSKTLKTTVTSEQVCHSIRTRESDAIGLLADYFEGFAKSMEEFCFDHEKGKKDSESDFELTINSIENFLPHRNEVVSVFYV